MTHPRATIELRNIAGTGFAGVAGAIVCVVGLPILGVMMDAALETFGLVRTALGILVASFTGWSLNLSAGTLTLTWIVSTVVTAIIGGLIGAFLGCLCAAVFLRRRLEA